MQVLREEYDIEVRVLGVCGSDRMLLSDTAVDLDNWQEQLQQGVRLSSLVHGVCKTATSPPHRASRRI